jgi:tetratricopeptide (TPR) repeat protein
MAMELWDYEGAGELLDGLSTIDPAHTATLFMRGKLLFHQGEYAASIEALDQALLVTPEAGSIQTLRNLVAETADVVRDYAVHTTADGLFEIRYDPSRDAVLIPWAEETLEAAYYEIGYDVGYWPEPPIRVEIYPEARTLARVSSLTEEAIEGSGTIALCKYNKLMFTSPRATLRGYGWRTTLAHEYVHYVVGHHVRADVPIWMHEALAKYLEERWTGTREIRMTPHREELLSERVEANTLITFEQMHPSMAYLPTPEDASVAYAEVFTVMEYLVSRRGSGVIRELLGHLRDGHGPLEAIEQTIGESFPVFEENWMGYLRGRPRVEIPGDFEDEIQLMPESGADAGVDRLAGIESVEAQDYLRLGELLRARDMGAAAVVEYQKAELLLGSVNPLLQNALARALLDLDRPEDALEAVAEVVEWHPSFYPSHLHRGEALSRLDRPEDALESLILAGGINPFDPAVHTLLSSVYQVLGDAERADQYREFARLVQ